MLVLSPHLSRVLGHGCPASPLSFLRYGLKDWEMRLTHLHDEATSKPFPGDMYQCELFMDSSAPGVDSIPLSSDVASAYAGGMRQQTFQDTRRGSKVLPGTGVIKECPYVEIYCDPEQTANHGLQTINEDPDSWIHLGFSFVQDC